jgi:hypothetical protein
VKYIFVAGAPGSKWSSVTKNIYYSADIDRSDYREEWTYWHDAPGQLELMHIGAYFDPGMECDLPEDISKLDRDQAEKIFDAPFQDSTTGIRIIKSHVFCYRYNLEYLHRLWPESAIIFVYRPDDACLGWWVKCGHFDITYPSYHAYYKDLREMANIISRQNKDLSQWTEANDTHRVNNNVELCRKLGITPPTDEYRQYYSASDVRVEVQLPRS